MKIYFTASIRGGRENQPEFEVIVEELKKYGDVSSQHVADEALTGYGETAFPDEEIRSRELEALAASDIVVADVTTPSLGVGYLIADASKLGKKIIALYRGSNTLKLSSLIMGDPNVTVHLYRDSADIKNILKFLRI